MYTAELSWSYVVTNHASLSSSAPVSVNPSAPGSVVMGFDSDMGGAAPGSLSATRRYMLLCLGEEFVLDFSAVIWVQLLPTRWACEASMGVAALCFSRLHWLGRR